MGFAYKGTYFIRPLTCFWRKCTIFVAQTRCQKAYLSRVQQQERLAIRYLKIGLSAQSPYYKGIKIIFQNYDKFLFLHSLEEIILTNTINEAVSK